MSTRKIAVFAGSRANWGRLRSVCKAIKEHDALELQLILGASFYNADVEYPVASRIQCLINADDHESMALTTGILLTKVSMELQRLKPDIVLVHGDRYEVLAVAQAAAYMNIPLAHTEGGEVTGCIDDKVRNAITTLADIHFPVTKMAKDKVCNITGRAWGNLGGVFTVGSTALDYIKEIRQESRLINGHILVLFHPNTTESEDIKPIIDACNCFNTKKIWINPNVDAGHMDILHKLHSTNWEFQKNVPTYKYARLIHNAKMCVGNSSSFIKEASFLGTPSVIVGSRQFQREMDCNVLCSDLNFNMIVGSMAKQEHETYKPSNYFGDGTASEKIVNILAEVEL
jgi:UDP-hydrolysing UDP-N-acetyl-D-glucosamine 2-epimerase